MSHKPSDRPVLTYWAVRGLGAQIRLALTIAGADFENNTVSSMAAFTAAQTAADHPLFNIPVLTTVDGQHITQSGAILRHVGREHGMDGKTATERARVEEMLSTLNDFRTDEVLPFLYQPTKPPSFLSERVPSFFGSLEKYMLKNGTSFIASNEVTIADCTFFTDLVNMAEVAEKSLADVLAEFPALWQLFETMAAMPAVQKYLEHEDMGKLPGFGAVWIATTCPDPAIAEFARTLLP